MDGTAVPLTIATEPSADVAPSFPHPVITPSVAVLGQSLATLRRQFRPTEAPPRMVTREPFWEKTIAIHKAGEAEALLLNRYPYLLLPSDPYRPST